MKAEINRYFEKNREAFLADLQALVAIESVKGPAAPGKPYGEGCAQVLERASEIGAGLGLKMRNFDNRVITAQTGPEDPVELGILAHLDVVPAGTGWHFPPFGGVIENGRMYGRGTADDKGACIAALYAMHAAQKLAGLKKGCRLIMGADEECGSSDLAYYKQQEAMPPYVFSPDADFPVYNIEKGQFSPSFSASWAKSGAGPRVLSLHSGTEAANVVPATAEAVLADLDKALLLRKAEAFSNETGIKLQCEVEEAGVFVKTTGVSAHASKPWEGKNALTALLAFLSRLPLEGDGAEKLRALSRCFPYGDNFGKALGIDQEDVRSGPLTVNFSILNVSESSLSGRLDCRTALSADLDAILARTRAAFDESGIRLTDCLCIPPHHTDENSPFVQTLLRVYGDYTGEKALCCAMGGCTYAHGIPGAVSFGPAFPGVETNLHGIDEYVVLEDLFKAAKIYTQVILDLCCA